MRRQAARAKAHSEEALRIFQTEQDRSNAALNGDVRAAHQILARIEHELGNLSILAALPPMVKTSIGQVRSEAVRATAFVWGWTEAVKHKDVKP